MQRGSGITMKMTVCVGIFVCVVVCVVCVFVEKLVAVEVSFMYDLYRWKMIHDTKLMCCTAVYNDDDNDLK